MNIKYLCHVWNTLFGFYHEPYLERWDKKLNEIMDNGCLAYVSEYTATFLYKGNYYTVWCGNKYYSYGHLYIANGVYVKTANQFRPRFRTMLKLEAIHESALRQKAEQAKDTFYGAI